MTLKLDFGMTSDMGISSLKDIFPDLYGIACVKGVLWHIIWSYPMIPFNGM
jgi:hypothetical protein